MIDNNKYNQCIINAHMGLSFDFNFFKEACLELLKVELHNNDKYNKEKLKQAALKMYNLIHIEQDPVLIKNNIEDGKITNKPVKKHNKNINKK